MYKNGAKITCINRFSLLKPLHKYVETRFLLKNDKVEQRSTVDRLEASELKAQTKKY